MKPHCRLFLVLGLILTVFLIGNVCDAIGFTVTGSVGQNGTTVFGGVVGKTKGLVKFKLENETSGVNLELCAGSGEDIDAKRCPLQLGISGAPSVQSFRILEASQLSGLFIYVIYNSGTAPFANFTVTVE